MKQQIAQAMKRWGQKIFLLDAGGEIKAYHAFLQSLQYKNKMYLQDIQTPIGASKQDYFLYIGPPELPLEKGWRLQAGGKVYQVVKSESYFAGQDALYVWAVVRKEVSEDGTF